MTRDSLRSLPTYQLGRNHEREHPLRTSPLKHCATLIGAFVGAERDAYLLGRMEERNDRLVQEKRTRA